MAFTRAPLRRLVKSHGIGRVSDDAVRLLAQVLEERVIAVLKEAEKIARHSGRKTIMREDVKLARKVVEGR